MKGEYMKSNCDVRKYFGYRPRYYLRHPFEWIKDRRKCRKWAKQRIVRGYADCDVWNLDKWFAAILPEMLNQLAGTTHGYPDQKFETFEEWQQWLRETAAAIRMMREEEQDAINPYWPAYERELEDWQYGYTPGEAAHCYWEEAKRIAADAQDRFEQAMISFSKNFSSVWD